jgi:RNA polymerase sigma-70 factor (ECF subfamily)
MSTKSGSGATYWKPVLFARRKRLEENGGSSAAGSAKTLVSALYAECYARFVGYAARSLGSMADAEDAVQDSFMELFHALAKGQAIENPQGWLLCTVRRRVIDRHRARKRRGELLRGLATAEDAAAPAGCGGEGGDLERLLAPLSPREEEVVLLRAEGLKYREIAVQLSITTNSVKTLLARAILKMHRIGASFGGRAERREVRTGAAETLQ